MKGSRLVRKAKNGSKEALLQLIMEEKDAYYRLALTYTGNTHDAMDAMEDMIVAVYEKIDQLKKHDAFYSWSKTILVNSCKRIVMKRNQHVLVEDISSTVDVAMNVSDPYVKMEQQSDIFELLSILNEHQRETIQLKYFHDLDYQTIATITNVSVGTAKSRVFQGLKKMREHAWGDRYERD